MKKMEEARNERRRLAEEKKENKVERAKRNEMEGKICDVDFQELIENEKKVVGKALNHVSSAKMRICICIRKRPLFAKETANGEIDSASMCNPKVIIHEPKVKVDGITKFVNNSSFEFDNTYSEAEPSHSVYEYQIKHLLPTLFKEGVVTCFAYGQTGSGKTFTVNSIN
jgi:kinesin family protein 2/24